jgi:hypothetical protein
VHDLTQVAPAFDRTTTRAWLSATLSCFRTTRAELRPWRLRVFPGTVLLGQGGEVLLWSAV